MVGRGVAVAVGKVVAVTAVVGVRGSAEGVQAVASKREHKRIQTDFIEYPRAALISTSCQSPKALGASLRTRWTCVDAILPSSGRLHAVAVSIYVRQEYFVDNRSLQWYPGFRWVKGANGMTILLYQPARRNS
jgi:hypothetical protein